MITVGRLAPVNQWDQDTLDLLIENRLYPTGLDFKRVEGYPPGVSGCIMFIPGRYWQGAALSEPLSRYKWVLAFRTSDEKDEFDYAQVEHPNIKWWIQNPRADREYPGQRLIGCGFTRHFYDMPKDPPPKEGLFLSAQNNHERRRVCFEQLRRFLSADDVINETEGFTQGLDPSDYADLMRWAKVAPCPAGVFTPDTFRVYEALESHTIPIADDISPQYDSKGYWDMVHPDAPFPVLRNPLDWTGYCEDQLDQWPHNAIKITAWWMRYKRKMAHWLREDLEALGAL